MKDTIFHAIRIIFAFWLFISPSASGANGPSIAWGQHLNGLSLGISLRDNENLPQSVVRIYLWAKTADGKEPPVINPYSISLMNYAPQDKTVSKASTNTDTWGKFHWEKVSDNIFKSKLLKVSSMPGGKWGIEATIPITWRGKSTEFKTGILEYTMR